MNKRMNMRGRKIPISTRCAVQGHALNYGTDTPKEQQGAPCHKSKKGDFQSEVTRLAVGTSNLSGNAPHPLLHSPMIMHGIAPGTHTEVEQLLLGKRIT
jgi:hypothetical protein